MPQIGDLVNVIPADRGRTIGKRVVRVAYARNGNFHNPTIYYHWELRETDGRMLGMFPTLREAKQAARTWERER